MCVRACWESELIAFFQGLFEKCMFPSLILGKDFPVKLFCLLPGDSSYWVAQSVGLDQNESSYWVFNTNARHDAKCFVYFIHKTT